MRERERQSEIEDVGERKKKEKKVIKRGKSVRGETNKTVLGLKREKKCNEAIISFKHLETQIEGGRGG